MYSRIEPKQGKLTIHQQNEPVKELVLLKEQILPALEQFYKARAEAKTPPRGYYVQVDGHLSTIRVSYYYEDMTGSAFATTHVNGELVKFEHWYPGSWRLGESCYGVQHTGRKVIHTF